MDSNQLRQLFAKALRASLASPLLLAGCGGLDLKGYSPPVCEDDWKLSMSGLSPATQPDLVQLRRSQDTGDGSSNPRLHTVLSSSGTACATASQPATCQAELAALAPQEGFRSVCNLFCESYYLATTEGDTVAAKTSLEALIGFLGAIDTPQEALLRVFADGYTLSCTTLERGAVKANGDGSFNVVATQGFACGEGTQETQFVLGVSASGEVVEKERDVLKRGDKGCSVGRRPAGLQSEGFVECADAVGRHLALIAHLEAASIQAFLRLRAELALHGADLALQDAALRSAMDEVMHTEVCGHLARKYGATPQRPQVASLPPRPLTEVLLDNAVEGCVRETYGALVAHHQALHAEDSEVREAMARIAEDETRHADLSWAIDRWASTRLPTVELEAVREARLRAIESLRAEVAEPTDSALIRELGLPAPEVAVALVDTLTRELWN
ncbi:ferritin-like domain-containing protein [Myxococcus sp. CA056]|uniref:ferritin-like domain-containing protein n=1 Tax=Myxococcus sp. CA056 TaxID=2741740 RepID=UPI00157B1930|nr:ferritin-like domain-containing protein [Myxococcus sp. CA056]NTX16858.1 ferritin-like domain-containing protein [Myxococcus sp. CA056]